MKKKIFDQCISFAPCGKNVREQKGWKNEWKWLVDKHWDISINLSWWFLVQPFCHVEQLYERSKFALVIFSLAILPRWANLQRAKVCLRFSPPLLFFLGSLFVLFFSPPHPPPPPPPNTQLNKDMICPRFLDVLSN